MGNQEGGSTAVWVGGGDIYLELVPRCAFTIFQWGNRDTDLVKMEVMGKHGENDGSRIDAGCNEYNIYGASPELLSGGRVKYSMFQQQCLNVIYSW